MRSSVIGSANFSNANQTLKYAAKQGKVAIEKAKELCPDLIVLDLSMPVMNGFDAARVLKQLMPAVPLEPLIMFSAFGDRFVEHQARLIGISEVVSKSEQLSVLIPKARGLLYSPAAGAMAARKAL